MKSSDRENYQKVANGMPHLVVSFASLAHVIYRDLTVFEFRRSLTAMNLRADLVFLKDSTRQWYLGELPGISSTFDETLVFLRKEIAGYENVVFIGASAGGYASILYGSLLKITGVVAFDPQTNLDLVRPGFTGETPLGRIRRPELKNIYDKYKDLTKHLNCYTHYFASSQNKPHDTAHYRHHFDHIEPFPNVSWLGFKPKEGIASGELRSLLQELLGQKV